jgi:pimeloyl-ACP methyl ester carboxylesterase
VPTVEINGISISYEVLGSGPPLLMFSPGGFNATMDNWRSLSVYGRFKPLEHLPERYRCIVFDQRESGQSGGRVERVTWHHYASQGLGLLDHLGIDRAHVMGGCMGCSSVVALAVAAPERVRSMVLFWPAGGVKYRLKGQARFAQHLGYVAEHGLKGVVELARSHDEPFTRDPRVGPWVTVLRGVDAFAEAYQQLDAERYQVTVAGMARTLFDRDTVPGAEPEDLLSLDLPSLVIPGQDTSHAPSAARYLEECLPAAEYWDVPVSDQTEETVPPRLLQFLDSVPSDDG